MFLYEWILRYQLVVAGRLLSGLEIDAYLVLLFAKLSEVDMYTE